MKISDINIKQLKDINIFDNPQYYRNKILDLIKIDQKMDFSGKSIFTVFFTKYCTVGCDFCFFDSPLIKKGNCSDQFDEKTLNNFIKFANCANIGYLLISGGGEPMLKRKEVIKTIKEVKSDHIVLVTSGVWAQNIKSAQLYLKDILSALESNKSSPRVTIRLSISQDHQDKLGYSPIINLINLFEEKYIKNKNLNLQIHTFFEQKIFDLFISSYPKKFKLIKIGNNISDDDKLTKIIPQKYLLKTDKGLNIIVGKSKIFRANLAFDICNALDVNTAISTYDNDIINSENDSPATVKNDDGLFGLNWGVYYHGNVFVWQSRINDNLLNVNDFSYKQALLKIFNDPLSLSFLEKGSSYRDRIVNEVNKKAVIRMKSVGLRDYAGVIIFEEERTRLFATIRMLQDFYNEKRININKISSELPRVARLIISNKNVVINEYNNSNFSIVDQYKRDNSSIQEWEDLFFLIKNSHYELSQSDIQDAISHYNSISNNNIKNISELKFKNKRISNRLTEKYMHK